MKRRITALILLLALMLPMALAFSIPAEAANHPGEYAKMSPSYKGGKYYKQLMAVNLTGNQIVDLINVARSQVNYTSGSSKNDLAGNGSGKQSYVEYFNLVSPKKLDIAGGAAWCATFVTWCFREAGIPTSIMPTTTGCGTVRKSVYKQGATYHSRESGYTPKAGDIILYEAMDSNYKYYVPCARDKNGVPTLTSHVGIVSQDYNGKTYTTIQRDGNTVREFKESITSKGPNKAGKYVINRIQGFLTPNYSNTKAVTPAVEVVKPTPVSTTPIIPSNGSLAIPPLTCVGASNCYIWPKATNAAYFNVTFRKASDTSVVVQRYDHLSTTSAAFSTPPRPGIM